MSRNKKKRNKKKNSTKPTINESETSTSNTAEVQTDVNTIARDNRISTDNNQATCHSPQAVTEEIHCDIYSYRSTYEIQAAEPSLLTSEGNLFHPEMKELVDAIIVGMKARRHLSDMTYLNKKDLKELVDENKSIVEPIVLKLVTLLKGQSSEFVRYVRGYIRCLSQISYLKDEKSLLDEDILLAYEEIKRLRAQCGANAQVTMAIAGTNKAISSLETRENLKKTADSDIVDYVIQKATNSPHNVEGKKDEKKCNVNNRCTTDTQSNEDLPKNVTEGNKVMKRTEEMQDETNYLKDLASGANEEATPPVTEEMADSLYSFTSTYEILAAEGSSLTLESEFFDSEMKKLVYMMTVCTKARKRLFERSHFNRKDLRKQIKRNTYIMNRVSLNLDKHLKDRSPEFLSYVAGYMYLLSDISYLKDKGSLSKKEITFACEEIRRLKEQFHATAKLTMAISGQNKVISYVETGENKKKKDASEIPDYDFQRPTNSPNNVESKENEKKDKVNNKCTTETQSNEILPKNGTEGSKGMKRTEGMQDETKDLKELANEHVTTTTENLDGDTNELHELYENTKVVNEGNDLFKEEGKVQIGQKEDYISLDDIQRAAHFSAILALKKKGPKSNNRSSGGFQTAEYTRNKVTEVEKDTKGFNKSVPDIEIEDSPINMERDSAKENMILHHEIDVCVEKEKVFFENIHTEIMAKKMSPGKTNKMTKLREEFQGDLKAFLTLQNSKLDEEIKERSVVESKSDFLKKHNRTSFL